jgi:von Willebrand factor type A domain
MPYHSSEPAQNEHRCSERRRRVDVVVPSLPGYGVEHRVSVIAFDGKPHLIVPFSSKTENASNALSSLSAGDHGAAILDPVTFAVGQLREQPTQYRRAIVLLSETIDQGSETKLLLRALNK